MFRYAGNLMKIEGTKSMFRYAGNLMEIEGTKSMFRYAGNLMEIEGTINEESRMRNDLEDKAGIAERKGTLNSTLHNGRVTYANFEPSKTYCTYDCLTVFSLVHCEHKT